MLRRMPEEGEEEYVAEAEAEAEAELREKERYEYGQLNIENGKMKSN